MGDELMSLFLESGASLIGEDLGTVPDFLRATLAERGVPGMKVLRWEREWKATGQPFIDPAAYTAGVGRDERHARHRDAWPSGGTAPRKRSASRSPASRRCARSSRR